MLHEHPTIMVVEDETLLLQAITKKLKLSGLDVISCASGQQAIDYLNNLDELPDAVWLDYYLKDMNGLAFMQSIKENEVWGQIPVLVVSNSASPDKVNNMLALGAKKYILKAEYRLDEIITMIQQFIKDAREDAGVPMPPAPAAAQQPAVADGAAPAPALTAAPATAPAPAPAPPAAAAPAPPVDSTPPQAPAV